MKFNDEEMKALRGRNVRWSAFCDWLLREAVQGYASMRAAGMPLPLAFLILPVVLHRPTRELAPGALTTKLHVWLQEHPEVRIKFAGRTKELCVVHARGPFVPWEQGTACGFG
jgi:hypothetical protein